MNQEHPYFDDLPAYALGALDVETTAALEAHLKECETCRADLAAYQSVTEGLLLAIPSQTPPARLRRRLHNRLPGAQKVLPFGFKWSFTRLSLTLAIVFLLAFNIYSLSRIQALHRQQAELARQYQVGQAALAMLASEETKSIPISAGNVTGTILLDQSHNTAMLIVWNLPELTEEQTYQAWLIDAQGKRTSAGIFREEAGVSLTSKEISSPVAISNFVGIGVTVEPVGGSSQPTGERIFKVDF